MGDLEHIDVGPRLTKVAWELTTAHHLASQAVGDMIYASTAAQLTGLGIGTAGAPLVVNDAGTLPAWSTRVLHTAGAYAFQEATTISTTTGGLELDSKGDFIFRRDGSARIQGRASDVRFLPAGAVIATLSATQILFAVAYAITIAANVDLTIGTPAGTGDLLLQANGGTLVALDGGLDGLGFYGTGPVAQQTGVAVSAAGIHAALVNLGLITA